MKCKMKVVCMVLIFTMVLSITASATIGNRNAELWYNNIKIVINGKEVVPVDGNGSPVEPFTIDGTTYLPVRAVATALNMNVGWNGATNTVTLDNPGVFKGAVQVYDDEYVTIEFAGCRAPAKDDIIKRYYVDFNVKNKTDAELTFQADAISLNGVSYKVAMGSDEVAPQSTGKVSFMMDDEIPTSGINKTSGQIKVIDFEKEVLESTYKAKWVDVTQ